MNRPIARAGLLFGALAFAQAGCHQADKAKTTDYIPKKPDDPTSWSSKDVVKGSSDSASDSLPQSSGVKGTWSSEAQSIEKSLGVTK